MKDLKKGGEAINLEKSNLLLTPKDIADFNPKWLINGFVETNKLISLCDARKRKELNRALPSRPYARKPSNQKGYLC